MTLLLLFEIDILLICYIITIIILSLSGSYSELCQTSMIEGFTKIVNGASMRLQLSFVVVNLYCTKNEVFH